jgi:hypothetical protein
VRYRDDEYSRSTQAGESGASHNARAATTAITQIAAHRVEAEIRDERCAIRNQRQLRVSSWPVISRTLR